MLLHHLMVATAGARALAWRSCPMALGFATLGTEVKPRTRQLPGNTTQRCPCLQDVLGCPGAQPPQGGCSSPRAQPCSCRLLISSRPPQGVSLAFGFNRAVGNNQLELFFWKRFLECLMTWSIPLSSLGILRQHTA